MDGTVLHDNYLRSAKEDLTVQDFSVWTDYMVKETADEWNTTVAAALQGDEDTQSKVSTLMYVQVLKPGDEYTFTHDPAVLNQAFTPGLTEVHTSNGVDGLVLRFKVTGDFNCVKAGTTKPYYKIPSPRDITFALIRNPKHQRREERLAHPVVDRHLQLRANGRATVSGQGFISSFDCIGMRHDSGCPHGLGVTSS